MRRLGLSVAALCCASAVCAQTEGQTPPLSGQVRLQWDQRSSTRVTPPQGPTNGLPSTSVAAEWANSATLETELHTSGQGWRATATAQQLAPEGNAAQSRAWFNELVASHDAGGWQLSAGKKIVAWDVGYSFRPNDLVQQEERRALVTTLPEGRPVLMAERFETDAAWSLVWVNPTGATSDPGAREPALVGRYYRRWGAVDGYGFARNGAQTGPSWGAAAVWVATDALALHASAHALNNSGHKVLVGGTWTHESQFSVLAEAWRDDTAQPRRNTLLRLAWEHDGWQPSLDWLHHPADGGNLWTAALLWKGDRVQLQGGLRLSSGPGNALLLQMPVQRQVYLAGTWSF